MFQIAQIAVKTKQSVSVVVFTLSVVARSSIKLLWTGKIIPSFPENYHTGMPQRAKYEKFGKLILRKIINIVTTRCTGAAKGEGSVGTPPPEIGFTRKFLAALLS